MFGKIKRIGTGRHRIDEAYDVEFVDQSDNEHQSKLYQFLSIDIICINRTVSEAPVGSALSFTIRAVRTMLACAWCLNCRIDLKVH